MPIDSVTTIAPQIRTWVIESLGTGDDAAAAVIGGL